MGRSSALLNRVPPAVPTRAVLAIAFLLAAAGLAGCTGEAGHGGGNGDPQVRGYVEKAWAMNAKAEFARAEEAASRALALDPENPDALAMRGWAYAGLGRYQEALGALEASLAKNPDNAIAWSNRGFSLYNLGRCDEAVTALDRALERDPYDLGAKKIRALALGKCPVVAAPVTTPAAARTGAAPEVTDNMNADAVTSGAACDPQFTFAQPVKVLTVINYHYHNGQGDRPGTIGLEDAGTGRVYGPYPATGSDGQGGVRNAFWTVAPGIVLPAGTYIVRDSNPSTWSQNAGTGRCGMSMITYEAVPS